MKYLLMIYAPEVDPSTVPPEQIRQVAADYDVFTREIVSRGVMLGGEALQPTTTATTLRIQDGRTVITDGPFAETKEALTGFYLVDVADIDEALELAARLPGANWGSIEVRPIWAVPGEIAGDAASGAPVPAEATN
ncbi:MAG TPA: YciI family protein [Candidatus Eisenbacteria bacterium]|nr:YciI family protein [Candidatus Eisenbacteria bacterium]